jgi:hypothetical protein
MLVTIAVVPDDARRGKSTPETLQFITAPTAGLEPILTRTRITYDQHRLLARPLAVALRI